MMARSRSVARSPQAPAFSPRRPWARICYVGSPFIATEEARAQPAQKQAIVDGTAADIVYSSFFTGVPGNYLRASIAAQGFDPDHRLPATPDKMDFGAASQAKAWRDI